MSKSVSMCIPNLEKIKNCNKPAIFANGKCVSYLGLSTQLNQLSCEFQKSVDLESQGNIILIIDDVFELLLSLLVLLRHHKKVIVLSNKNLSEDALEVASRYESQAIFTDSEPLKGQVISPNREVTYVNFDALPSEAQTSHASCNFEFHESGEIIIPHNIDEIAGDQQIDLQGLIDSFDTLDDHISLDNCDSYVIYGRLDPIAFIIESLWALHNSLKLILLKNEALFENYCIAQKGINIDFGLFFFGSYSSSQTTSEDYHWLLETVKKADSSNFSSVWTPERHFNSFGGMFPNPSILSAALASITQEIQIRCGSIVSPLHHSVRIAEDWSLIDNLSNGRVGLSFASGWQCNDFVFSPDQYKERHSIMMQQIKEVRELWSGKSIALKNGLGDLIEVEIYPKPKQKNIPIWVTVSGKTETFIDAGKIGANILTHLLWQDPDQLVEKINAYRNSLRESGYDPEKYTVSVMAHTFIGADDESVKEAIKKPLKEYIRSSVNLIETMSGSSISTSDKEQIGRYGNFKEKISENHLEELLEIAFERFFEKAGLLGSEERCHAFIEKLKGYDVDDIACLVDFGVSHEDIDQSLERLSNLKSIYCSTHILKCKSSILRIGKNKDHSYKKIDKRIDYLNNLAMEIYESKEELITKRPSQSIVEYTTDSSQQVDLTFTSFSSDNYRIEDLSEAINEEF